LGLFGVITVIILSIAIFSFISFIQEKLFVPNNSIIWVIKSPVSKFVFIYEFYLMYGFFLLLYRDLRKWSSGFYKKHHRTLLPIFGIVNIMLLYAIITNVAVVTHSFLIPQGMFETSHLGH
jgi:hypothetical protein